ncbi:MAG: hypothetical protein PUG48_07765 [Clostridia bacterium]|nr:hypothetical protein [Clostridia bacterium]
MKKNIVLIVTAVILSLVVGFTLSFSFMVLEESEYFFNRVNETKKDIDDFKSSDFLNKYIFKSGILNGNGNEEDLIKKADEGLKKDSNYVGMLYKQRLFDSLTVIPKDSEKEDFKKFNIDNTGMVVGGEYYVTSSPLTVEDTYSKMNIYNELDKNIMCRTYKSNEQIPVYVSKSVAEKYNLSEYAYGVGTVYDEETEKYKSVTLNFKIIGIIDEPSFSTAKSSSSINWEIAMPSVDYSDKNIFTEETSTKTEKIFVFKMDYNSMNADYLKKIKNEISKYATITENSDLIANTGANFEYNYQNDNYPRYTVEKIMSVISIILIFILSVVLFGLIYKNMILDSDNIKPAVPIISILADVLIIIGVSAINYRMEFSDDRFSMFAIPDSTFGNNFVLFGSIIFTAVSAVCVFIYIMAVRLIKKKIGEKN